MVKQVEILPGNISHSCPPIEAFQRCHPQTEALIYDRTHAIVPAEVIDATEGIMMGSQRNFLATWLPDYLYQRRMVMINDQDRKSSPDFDFEAKLHLIAAFRDGLLETEDPLYYVAQRNLEKIRATVATNRIMHAVVKREVEGVTRFLALGAAVSGLEFIVQEKFGIKNNWIYVLASTLDNGIVMIGEVDKLRRQGFSFREAWEAMRVPGGVLGGSILTSFLVHNRFEEGQDTLAGFLYGSESAICVSPSVAGAISSMRPEYYQLVLEGKVNDPVMETLLIKESPNLFDKIKTFIIGSARALKQDMIYPHHIGLYSGAAMGIVLSTILASIQTPEGGTVLQRPLILGPLGIADSAGGAIAGLAIDKIYDYKLQRDLKAISCS